jgi:glycosyltransferase involved in cell wall biosynthesis
VNPLSLEEDPRLERLIVELPFGTPDETPPPRPLRSDLLEGVSESDPLLYFGGIYDWYDPELVVGALGELMKDRPGTTVIFVDHPHPELTPLSAATRLRQLAEERGWLGSRLRFEEWRPYDRRFDLAVVSDLAVVCHRPGLETDLSLRTRLVDMLWLGLPLVVTEGGTMARVVRDTGAGIVVQSGDVNAVASAVRALLDDPGRRRAASEAGRRWADEHRWHQVAAPLLSFAEQPWRDPHRDRFAGLAPRASTAEEPVGNRVRRLLRRLGGDW